MRQAGYLAPRQAVPGMASWFRGSRLRANFPPAARSFGPAHNSLRARKRALRSNKCAEHETRAERPLAAGAAQIGHAEHRLPRQSDAAPPRPLTPPLKSRASGSRRALCGADGEQSCRPCLMLAALVRAERVFRAQRVAPRAARLRTAGGSPARPARDATPGRRGPLARGFARRWLAAVGFLPRSHEATPGTAWRGARSIPEQEKRVPTAPRTSACAFP